MSGNQKSCWQTYSENSSTRWNKEPNSCLDWSYLQLCCLAWTFVLGTTSATSGICFAAGIPAGAELAKDFGIAAAATCGATVMSELPFVAQAAYQSKSCLVFSAPKPAESMSRIAHTSSADATGSVDSTSKSEQMRAYQIAPS